MDINIYCHLQLFVTHFGTFQCHRLPGRPWAYLWANVLFHTRSSIQICYVIKLCAVLTWIPLNQFHTSSRIYFYYCTSWFLLHFSAHQFKIETTRYFSSKHAQNMCATDFVSAASLNTWLWHYKSQI